MTGTDFWSRRKAAVAAETRNEMAAAEAERLEAEHAEATDEELLAERNLPDPETLTNSADVRTFLESDLPQRLKSRALRQLWRMNPVLANVDGLVDYGEDYTDAALAVDKIETLYQVGKGMLSAIIEDEKEAQPSEPDAPLALEESPEPETSPSAADVPEDAPIAQAEPVLDDDPTPEADDEALVARSTARRMQFTFEATT